MVFWSGFIKKIKNAVTKERVDKLEQKINTNATNIELVEQDVETNTTNIGTIRNEMIMLKQEDNNIKRRLEQAETNITQTNNELDSLEANVNGFDARITEANNKANEANTKATSAEEQATRLGLTVSNNSTKIAALESKNIKKLYIDASKFTLLTDRYSGNIARVKKFKCTWDKLNPVINVNRVVGCLISIWINNEQEWDIVYVRFYNEYIELACTLLFRTQMDFTITGNITILYV